MLCNWSWPTTERVSRVIVSVVLPCVTSIHFTLMLALGLGLAVTVAVAVGVATGVPLPVFGVLVGLGVAVATGVLVGVGVPFPGVAVAFAVGVGETVGVAVAVTFVVLGSVLSRLWISLILGMSFGANLVMVTTVTVFPPNVRSSKVGSSWLPYFVCRADLIVFCTKVSMRTFKRTQTVCLPGKLVLSPVITCSSVKLRGLSRFLAWVMETKLDGRRWIVAPPAKSMPTLRPRP